MAVVLTPGGWGWPPGTNIATVEPADMPALVLPADPRLRMRVIREAAPHFPGGTTARTVSDCYGIPYSSAFDLVNRVERRKPASNNSRPGATP